jgi:hypothetical protein
MSYSPIPSGLKQTDYFSPFIFNVTFEYSIRVFQVNQNGLTTIAVLVGPEINAERTKYVVVVESRRPGMSTERQTSEEF